MVITQGELQKYLSLLYINLSSASTNHRSYIRTDFTQHRLSAQHPGTCSPWSEKESVGGWTGSLRNHWGHLGVVFFKAPIGDQQGSWLKWGRQQQKCLFQWSQVSAGIFPEDHKCLKKIDCHEWSLGKLLGRMEGSFHCHLKTWRARKSEVITDYAFSQGKCKASHKEPRKASFKLMLSQALVSQCLLCANPMPVIWGELGLNCLSGTEFNVLIWVD